MFSAADNSAAKGGIPVSQEHILARFAAGLNEIIRRGNEECCQTQGSRLQYDATEQQRNLFRRATISPRKIA